MWSMGVPGWKVQVVSEKQGGVTVSDSSRPHLFGSTILRTSRMSTGCMEYVTTQTNSGDSRAALMSSLKQGLT